MTTTLNKFQRERLERKHAGLCTSCGERDDDARVAGFVTCGDCRKVATVKAHRARSHYKRRDLADATSLCRICIREPRLDGRTRCAGCVARYRVMQRARRDQFVASGWCSECRKAPRQKDNRRCAGCAELNRIRARKSKQAARAQEAA